MTYPLTVEIKNDNGKLSGKIDTPQGPSQITSGTFADGKIMMKFDAGGNEGTVEAMLNGDKIIGKWALSGMGGPLELKRAGATAAATPPAAATPLAAATPAPAGGDPITGEWAASAEVSRYRRFLSRSNSSSKAIKSQARRTSDQGTAPLSKGTWSANNLTFALDTPNGVIGFKATLKEGKLMGEFDFAGQMTGKWEAKKK